MLLRYTTADGKLREFKPGKDAITIGRSADSDIAIPDKLVSRRHCGISFRDGICLLRDFTSRNGTFVNGRRVDVVRLNSGDRIQIGSAVITVESAKRSKGTATVMKEIKEEMDKGKGYRTMLIEIVSDEGDEKK